MAHRNDGARILFALLATILGTGTAGTLWPAWEVALGAGAALALVLIVAAAAVRRKLRIRRRLAAIQPLDRTAAHR